MISLQDITVTFNPVTPITLRALNGLNLDIAAGEFITMIGSNGAGKSTLLNVLSGEQTPDRGSVIMADRDVTIWNTPRRAKLVARVFQNPLAGSCAQLTVEENLALAACRGRSRGLRFALTNQYAIAVSICLSGFRAEAGRSSSGSDGVALRRSTAIN